MNDGAWRSTRHLIYSPLVVRISLPDVAWADTAEQVISYDQQTGVHRRDRVPTSPTRLDTSPITTRPDLQIVNPEAALTGGAFPCHDPERRPEQHAARYAERFFIDEDIARSLSEVPVTKGMAFALRYGNCWPVFQEYADAEAIAGGKRAGIWASTHFGNSYGERYRANPTMH